jgi:HK97 family phage major capsid protein
MDKVTLDRLAGELNEQAQACYKDLVEGKVTEAEFGEKMTKIETENARNEVLFKSRARANQFQVLQEESGAPPQQDEVHADILEYRKSFAEISKAAKKRYRGGGSFNFGYKSWLDNDNAMDQFAGMAGNKTGMPFGPYQGVTGMTGENATGTSAGSALGGGAYFLTGTAGPAIEPEFLPGIVEMRFFPTVIESLFPALPVSSPVITYVTETGWTNNAAATGEAATKPTSTHTLQRYTEQVGKIANLERTTDEMIQDAAYVWALFQRRLVMGVQRRTELELLAGSGYPGVNGLFGRSASFTQGATVGALSNVLIPPTLAGPFGSGMGSAETVTSVTPGRAIVNASSGSTAPTGNDIALGILQMITDIRTTVFFEPDAIVMNPQDYYTLRTAVDKNGQYFGGSFWGRDYGYPADQAQLSAGGVDTFTLWGKKLVTTPVIPPGLILVGDFADAGAVLRLGGLRVDVTNLNGSDFEQNMWTARAEARVGLLIERPYLFELGVLTTSSTWSS